MPETGTHNRSAEQTPASTGIMSPVAHSGSAGSMLDTLGIRIGISVSVLPVQVIISVL
jgi:hypothetical protein